eukprot:1146258-Pelagomonas_calceolata.AAC.4
MEGREHAWGVEKVPCMRWRLACMLKQSQASPGTHQTFLYTCCLNQASRMHRIASRCGTSIEQAWGREFKEAVHTHVLAPKPLTVGSPHARWLGSTGLHLQQVEHKAPHLGSSADPAKAQSKAHDMSTASLHATCVAEDGGAQQG